MLKISRFIHSAMSAEQKTDQHPMFITTRHLKNNKSTRACAVKDKEIGEKFSFLFFFILILTSQENLEEE